MTSPELIAHMSADDVERWEERAAILEYCAHLPRDQAEVMALMMMKRERD